MNKTIRTLPDKVRQSLDLITGESHPARLQKALLIIDEALLDLDKKWLTGDATDLNAEVELFRSIRPQLLSFRIEEKLRYQIYVNRPIGTAAEQIAYIEDELRTIATYFRRYAFHYQYYRNDFRELDDLFFRKSPVRQPAPLIPDRQSAEAPPVSDLFARFMAYERMQNDLAAEVTELQYTGLTLQSGIGPQEQLAWTGEIVNVVELAYGLWLTGQLNHGTASLAQIIRCLEDGFKIRVGIPAKRFAEISRRKTQSTTRYLDQMKDAIIKKVRDDIDT